MATAEQLGAVSCPSGILLVLDGGLASLWSHDRAPRLPEWSDVAEIANSAVDLEVRGPDALEAGRAFDRSLHPLFVYDQPRQHLEELHRSFRERARERNLDAALFAVERVPHRRRVDLALQAGAGAGIVQFHGMWAAAVGGVPRGVPLRVLGERMQAGPDAERWRRVSIEVRPGVDVVRSRVLGHVLVDEGRLMAVDVEALGAWDEDPVDGKADVVFWGRDAAAAAAEVGAGAVRLEGERDLFGWTDLPLDDALERGRRVDAARTADRELRLDFRPHTHHWRVMRDVRASATQSGVLELAGTRLCMFMTSWGDGAFLAEVDVDAADRPVRVRLELGCETAVQPGPDLPERG